jgi:demethylmenaquinone methyltransferase/2-methoxy-6-polyprenyl-1,4-benzoquinol methylase
MRSLAGASTRSIRPIEPASEIHPISSDAASSIVDRSFVSLTGRGSSAGSLEQEPPAHTARRAAPIRRSSFERDRLDVGRTKGRPMADPSRDPSPDAADPTHFGYADVALGDKQRLVDDVFDQVAQRYDVMNDLMSGGLHRAWKNVFAAQVKPARQRVFRHLDVAGGTGDIAFRVAEAGGRSTEVTVLDINPAMLDVGRGRAAKRDIKGPLTFVTGNAEALPLPDATFDAYTIAFGIRNVPRIDLALREAHRVLKRGGHFLCLEFSAVDVPGLDRLYDTFSFKAIPAMGRLVAGDAEPYRYLVESIRRFPGPERFAGMIEEAGFRRVVATRLTGGVVAIHSAWKL